MEVNGCIPDIVSVSSTGVTVTVDNTHVVARLRAELAERVNITAENSKALVSLVADDVRRIVALPTQLFLSLDGIEVWLASPVASRRSFSFVISEKDVPEEVLRLHESFLQDHPSPQRTGAEGKIHSAVVAQIHT